MSNTINSGIGPPQLKNMGPIGNKKSAGKGAKPHPYKDKDFDVSLSQGGKSLSNMEAMQKKGKTEGAIQDKNPAIGTDEEKLSPKAKDFLEKLRQNYGDYGFVIADNVDNPLDVIGPSDKKYFVVLSSAELERMADDEEYANEVMGKVDSSINKLNEIQEKGLLGEGVRFKRIAISFDDEGNTKLFAELERMSEQQQERLKAAREKRVDEKRLAEKEKAKAPPERPPIPTYQEMVLAVKATIESSTLTSEKVFSLLNPGSELKSSQSASTFNFNLQIEATIRSTYEESSMGLPHHRPHHGHHAHHAHHSGFDGPQDRRFSGDTVRIEADSADELLEKANNIDWSNIPGKSNEEQ